jgi:hypothetical protein
MQDLAIDPHGKFKAGKYAVNSPVGASSRGTTLHDQGRALALGSESDLGKRPQHY